MPAYYPFSHVSVIGIGLIGASIIHAAKHRQLPVSFTAYDNHPDVLSQAANLLSHAQITSSLQQAVVDADLVILAVVLILKKLPWTQREMPLQQATGQTLTSFQQSGWSQLIIIYPAHNLSLNVSYQTAKSQAGQLFPQIFSWTAGICIGRQ